MTLVTSDGEVVLAVGAEVPASSDRIVAAGGVYQVAGSFVDGLTKEPGDWRDKKLLPPPAATSTASPSPPANRRYCSPREARISGSRAP